MIVKHNGDEIANVQIAVGKNPLRESHISDNTKRILVPDGAEYEITIKNQLTTPLLVKVSVDGTVITGMSNLVIYGGQVDHLERFLDIDKKLRFVRYKGSGQESSVNENDAGKIDITLRHQETDRITLTQLIKEFDQETKKWPKPRRRRHYDDWVPSPYPWPNPYWHTILGETGTGNWHPNDGKIVYSCSSSKSMSSNSILNPDEKGVTVEGNHSCQTFKDVNIDDSLYIHTKTLHFILRVADKPMKQGCSLDHNTLRAIGNTYCSECGNRL